MTFETQGPGRNDGGDWMVLLPRVEGPWQSGHAIDDTTRHPERGFDAR